MGTAFALGAAPAVAHASAMLAKELVEQGDPLGADRLQAAIPTREEPAQTATPRAVCGPGARPEPSIHDRVPAASLASGDALPGYFCTLSVLGWRAPRAASRSSASSTPRATAARTRTRRCSFRATR